MDKMTSRQIENAILDRKPPEADDDFLNEPGEFYEPYLALFCAAFDAMMDLEQHNYGIAHKALQRGLERAQGLVRQTPPEFQEKLEELKKIALDKGLYR